MNRYKLNPAQKEAQTTIGNLMSACQRETLQSTKVSKIGYEDYFDCSGWQFEGLYNLEDGDFAMIYISNGWIYKYFVMNAEQLAQLKAAYSNKRVATNAHFEF